MPGKGSWDCHSSRPVLTSSARNLPSRVAPMKTSPPPVTIGPPTLGDPHSSAAGTVMPKRWDWPIGTRQTSFPLLMSIFFLAAIIVGGMGTILGGILGAVFMTLVPEVLKLVFELLPGGTEMTVFLSPVRTVVFGLLIVGFLVFEPHGLAEVWRRIRRFFHLWPFRN